MWIFFRYMLFYWEIVWKWKFVLEYYGSDEGYNSGMILIERILGVWDEGFLNLFIVVMFWCLISSRLLNMFLLYYIF